MSKRGRKPVNMGLLNSWEFEFYKALNHLRDGTELPPAGAFEQVNRRTAIGLLEWWKKAKPEEILGDMLKLDPPRFSELATTAERARAKREWIERERRWLKEFAELERQQEIAALEGQLKPRKIERLADRREIWDALIRARTISAVQQACERWRSLPDVRTRFPAHAYILSNVKQFLFLKRDARFPKSGSPAVDHSRLEYVARGMAGVLVNVSPITAIERLRNMKHGRNGPLWTKEPGGLEYCGCWRCRLERSQKLWSEVERRITEQGVGR